MAMAPGTRPGASGMSHYRLGCPFGQLTDLTSGFHNPKPTPLGDLQEFPNRPIMWR